MLIEQLKFNAEPLLRVVNLIKFFGTFIELIKKALK